MSIKAKFNLQKWLIINPLFWSLGFAVGLIAGFTVPVLGDVIAVIVFTVSVLYFQKQILVDTFDWAGNYIDKTYVGFFIGLTISFIFTLIFDNLIGLSLAHIFAFPIVILGAIWAQYLELNKHYENASNWIWANIGFMAVSFLVLSFVNLLVDLRFDLLSVRRRDFCAVLPWWFVGATFGAIYSMFTGLVLSSRWGSLIKKNG